MPAYRAHDHNRDLRIYLKGQQALLFDLINFNLGDSIPVADLTAKYRTVSKLIEDLKEGERCRSFVKIRSVLCAGTPSQIMNRR